MARYTEGMKVRLLEDYRDVNADGFGRESGIRYVACDLGNGSYILAKTKKQGMNGEGQIYGGYSIEKILGWGF